MLRFRVLKEIIMTSLILTSTHILLADVSGMGSVITGEGDLHSSIIKGDGNIISITRREIDSAFSAIDSDGVFDLTVTNSKMPSVEVQTDKNLMQYIKTEIKDNTLIIRSTKNVSTDYGIKINISMPKIDNAVIAGSSEFTMNKFRRLTEFSLNLSGSSEAKITGITKKFNAHIIGACELNAEEFKTEQTIIVLNGASEAIVRVNRKLDATLDGAGDLVVYGNPKSISKKIRGVGEIVFE